MSDSSSPFSGNIPGFSLLAEMVQNVQKAMQPLAEITASMQAFLQSFVAVIAEFQPKIDGIIAGLKVVYRPLIVIEKLGDAQFVQWDYLSEEYIEAILNTSNVNKTLRNLLEKDKFQFVNITIEKCKANPYLRKYMRLFEQSVTAFTHGQNDLAIIGFTSIFDGLLSDISGNSTHQLKPRLEIIESKLEKEEVLDSNEYAILALVITFQKAIATFALHAPFDGKEPSGLNRHWIAHGRSRRRKTKLDCVKLINLIYGLLLIHELDTMDITPENF